jgi:hypothetical protein
MRIAVVSIASGDVEQLAGAKPEDMIPLYHLSVEGNSVAAAPVDRSDIAQGTECHFYFPAADLRDVYEEAVRPVTMQVCTRQAAQGCIVVDGPSLARFHTLHDSRCGLLRLIIAECCASPTVQSVEVGFAEVDVGDAVVDMLDPRASHPPTVVDDTVRYCSLLHGLTVRDGRDPETLNLIDSLSNPSRHQIVSIAIRHAAPKQPRSGTPTSPHDGAVSVTWLYVVSLAVREVFRQPVARGANSTAGPFRAALQSVTGSLSGPTRPSSIPFSHSKLTHLLKPCLCDELQPAVWIVALLPQGPGHRQRPADAFKDASVAISSARRVASVCRAQDFPHDLIDVAVSPKSHSRSPGRNFRNAYPNDSNRGGQEAGGSTPWLSPGEAAYRDAMDDDGRPQSGPHSRRSASDATSPAHAPGVRLTSILTNNKESRRQSLSSGADAHQHQHHVDDAFTKRSGSISPTPNGTSAVPHPMPLDGSDEPTYATQAQNHPNYPSKQPREHTTAASGVAAAAAAAMSRTGSSVAAMQRTEHDLAAERRRNSFVEQQRAEQAARNEQQLLDLQRKLDAERAQREDTERSMRDLMKTLEAKMEAQALEHAKEVNRVGRAAGEAERQLRDQLKFEMRRRTEAEKIALEAERSAAVAAATAQAAATAAAMKPRRTASNVSEIKPQQATPAAAAQRSGKTTPVNQPLGASAAASRAATPRSASASKQQRESGSRSVSHANSDAEGVGGHDGHHHHAAVQMQFQTYREAMEPTLRRLRLDAERTQAAATELEGKLRSKERAVSRLESELTLLQRELHMANQHADDDATRKLDDASAAMAEAARCQRELKRALEELQTVQQMKADLEVCLENETSDRVQRDDIIDGLRSQLAILQRKAQAADEERPLRANYGGRGGNSMTVATQTSLTAASIERLESNATVSVTEIRVMESRIRELEYQLRETQQQHQHAMGAMPPPMASSMPRSGSQQQQQQSHRRSGSGVVSPPHNDSAANTEDDVRRAALDRVAELEAQVREARRAEQAAHEEAVRLRSDQSSQMRHQPPQHAAASVQAGTARDYDFEVRAASARHRYHRSGLESPDESPGKASARRGGTASMGRDDSPGKRTATGRSTSAPRSAPGIMGNFQFRPEDYKRVEENIARIRLQRDASQSH